MVERGFLSFSDYSPGARGSIVDAVVKVDVLPMEEHQVASRGAVGHQAVYSKESFHSTTDKVLHNCFLCFYLLIVYVYFMFCVS